jgi:hypothetical protein
VIPKRAIKGILIGSIIPIGIVLGIARVVMTSACACTDKADTIVNCLSQLDAAKLQWTIDHKGAVVTNLSWTDLSPYVQSDFWNHPFAGETYFINKMDEPASALVPKKTDWIPANSEVRLSPDRKVQIRSTLPGSNWAAP